MMNMKKLSLTFILTLVLSASAFAGTMEIGEIAPPTAPATAPTQGGDPLTSGAPSATAADDTSAADVSATEAALAAVETALALF